MNNQLLKGIRQRRRVQRVRKKIWGSPDRPRLAVTRTHRNIGAQIIDDSTGRTLCSASTEQKDLRDQIGYGGNVVAAKQVGQLLGERAKGLGIEVISFDRRGWRYHGRIKALADAVREAGLKF